MKKHTIRMLVGLITFLIGTAIHALLFLGQPPHEQSHQSPAPVNVTSKILFGGSWRRIEVGRVSFSIPASLEKTGLPGNAGVIDALAGLVGKQGFLYINYSYGKSVSSDYNTPTGDLSELLIDGRPARLYVRKLDEQMFLSLREDSPTMELLVPDVGDGSTKFQLYVAGFDLELMRQVIDSVEIREQPLIIDR